MHNEERGRRYYQQLPAAGRAVLAQDVAANPHTLTAARRVEGTSNTRDHMN